MLRDEMVSKTHGDFAFRVKLGEYEVEICGSREEVLKTIQNLPSLMINVQKAFEAAKPKTVATLTVKTEQTKDSDVLKEKYPKILQTEKFDEATLKILETDWGKWRPRRIDELREALNANGMKTTGRSLARILMDLAKRGKVRRWSTDTGYVYILAEKEALT